MSEHSFHPVFEGCTKCAALPDEGIECVPPEKGGDTMGEYISTTEVPVEGFWFKRDELPVVLGNFMRSAQESQRREKDLLVALTELRAVRGEDAYEYRRVSRAGRIYFATFESMPELNEGESVQRRILGPWEVVE